MIKGLESNRVENLHIGTSQLDYSIRLHSMVVIAIVEEHFPPYIYIYILLESVRVLFTKKESPPKWAH